MLQFVDHPITLPAVTEEVERLTEMERERKTRECIKVQMAIDWARPDEGLSPQDLL